jgi:hypothetical protein
MDYIIKNSLNNFSCKSSKQMKNLSSNYDIPNISIQLNRLNKMLENSVMKFTRRYLIISTELEEMKREYIGNMNIINEFINLTRKEIRYNQYDNFNPSRTGSINNIPLMPNYENRSILNGIKKENKTSYNKIMHNNIDNKKNYNKNRSLSRLYSPDINKKASIKNYNESKTNHFQKNNSVSQLTKSLNTSKSNTSINKNYYFTISQREKKDDIINLLSDNKTKALYILLNSKILNYEEKLKLLYTKKNLLLVYNPTELLNNEMSEIQKNIKDLQENNNLTDEERKIIENILKYPTKTAKTGLNFLSEEKEKELMKNEIEDNLLLIKMIFTLLNENKDELNIYNIKDNYNQILNKYNVNSLKDLFIKIIYKKIYDNSLDEIDKSLNNKIIEYINQNKSLITEIIVNNINKNFSYVAFSLDEICDYLTRLNNIEPSLKKKLKIEKQIQDLLKKQEIISNKIKSF